jgi:hypothetical protein
MRAACCGVERVHRGFAGHRVQVLDDRVAGERERAAVLGGADELVVDELVRVALVEDLAGFVDRAELVGVAAGDERVGGVLAAHDAGLPRSLVPTTPMPGRSRRRSVAATGVEVQVVGGEEQQRLGRRAVAGLILRA